MDARFITRGAPRREDMTALARTAGKRSRILLCVLALVWWVRFACEIYAYYWDMHHTALLAFALAFTLFVIFFPHIAGWNMWRTRNRSITETTMAFSDTGVHTSNNLSESTIKYDAIVRIVESDGYFYLYMQKRLIFSLSKANFIQGNPAEFGAFIREKTGLEIKRVRG